MRTILFVCLHGSAKSLIAAEHLNRLARARGLPLRGESAGIDPDESVPPPVVSGLAADGIDVQNYTPGQVTRERLAAADTVVSMGCDITELSDANRSVRLWDDLPMVSDGYDAARSEIVARVEQLLSEIHESSA
jgi:protein-tyrosine-phosphatase